MPAEETIINTRPHRYTTKILLYSEKMADNESKSHDPRGDTEAIAIDDELNERSLLRKLDRRLLPAVGVLYLLSFLDRSNGGTSQT